MIVVSHRGPVSFQQDPEGSFTARRGAGGVVSALAPLLAGRGETQWIAAALTDDDRAAVAAGAVVVDGLDVSLLALDPEVHRLHYDVISNRILWFCFHGLFDLPREPVFNPALHEAWDAYRAVNRQFALAVAETAPEGDVVLVQDLQLLLVPRFLSELRPDLAISHFTHTPFCGPNSIRVLPDHIAEELCQSLSGTAAGFHSTRWVRAFEASAVEVLGVSPPTAFCATFGPDPEDLAATAGSVAAAESYAAFDARVGDRRCIVRTDRMELSKNITRGFVAFDELLDQHPEQRERVTFVAMLNPSREGLAEYRDYRVEVEATAARVNDRWATSDWEPIIVDTRDDFPRSVAALQRADVMLVNPVKDGLNLVALEGPLLNQRDAVLCLSREAGAFDRLSNDCVPVQPFDTSQTAAALHTALSMDRGERRARAAGLRAAALARPASVWLDELVSRARGAQPRFG